MLLEKLILEESFGFGIGVLRETKQKFGIGTKLKEAADMKKR